MEHAPQGHNPDIDPQLQRASPERSRFELHPIDTQQPDEQSQPLAPKLGRHALGGAGLQPIQPAQNPPAQPERNLKH